MVSVVLAVQNEQNVGKIIGNVHVMIGERVVLFRIQHFQKGAGRISAIVSYQLIHLIQHHYRIGSAASLHYLP